MHPTHPDADLLRASRDDPAAFRAFYDLCARDVLAYFYRRTLDPQDAADLMMETFADAYEHRARFRDMGKPASAWLFGIARRELARFWRDQRVELRAVQRLGIETPPLDSESIQRIEELVDLEALKPKLSAALQGISLKEREAVRMRVIEDMDYEEIGRTLGCSAGAARVRVHRGLARLNTILETTS